MRTSEEKIQVEVEMGTPFVKINFKKLGTWTTETWLKMMCKNLGSLEIELLRRDLPLLLLNRKGDMYIMSEFVVLYDMDKITMRILNRICLLTKFYAMSDLETGNCLSIRKDMVAAFTPGTEEQSQYEWPQ